MRPRTYKGERSSVCVWFSGYVLRLGRLGITKRHIAEQIGVSHGTVCSYCYRLTPPKIMWISICDALAFFGAGRFSDLYREVDMFDRGVYT